jgi:hypothetical protein
VGVMLHLLFFIVASWRLSAAKWRDDNDVVEMLNTLALQCLGGVFLESMVTV